MAKNEEEGGARGVAKKGHENVFAALSAFQGDLKPIEQSGNVNFKTKAGETVAFKYAPLGKIMEVIYPLLAKHGLSVRWELSDGNVECFVTHEASEEHNEMVIERTWSNHEEGEKTDNKEIYGTIRTQQIRSGKLAIDTKKSEMKDVGAQITYARRYTIGLVLGLATEEDKDAQLFEQSNKNVADFAFKQAKSVIEKAPVGEKLDEQVAFLEKELKMAEELEAGTGKKVPALGLKAEQYKSLLAVALQKKEGVAQDENGS